jgi:hypothetical protein
MFTLSDRVYDHCNGLVLFEDGLMYMCNPVMRRGAWLPEPNVPGGDLDLDTGRRRAFIAFDPAAHVAALGGKVHNFGEISPFSLGTETKFVPKSV